jgi:hypothetical protein
MVEAPYGPCGVGGSAGLDADRGGLLKLAPNDRPGYRDGMELPSRHRERKFLAEPVIEERTTSQRSVQNGGIGPENARDPGIHSDKVRNGELFL